MLSLEVTIFELAVYEWFPIKLQILHNKHKSMQALSLYMIHLLVCLLNK